MLRCTTDSKWSDAGVLPDARDPPEWFLPIFRRFLDAVLGRDVKVVVLGSDASGMLIVLEFDIADGRLAPRALRTHRRDIADTLLFRWTENGHYGCMPMRKVESMLIKLSQYQGAAADTEFSAGVIREVISRYAKSLGQAPSRRLASLIKKHGLVLASET